MVDGFSDPKVVSFDAYRTRIDQKSQVVEDEGIHPRAITLREELISTMRSRISRDGLPSQHDNFIEIAALLDEMLDELCSVQDDEIAQDLLSIDEELLTQTLSTEFDPASYSATVNVSRANNWVDLIDDN